MDVGSHSFIHFYPPTHPPTHSWMWAAADLKKEAPPYHFSHPFTHPITGISKRRCGLPCPSLPTDPPTHPPIHSSVYPSLLPPQNPPTHPPTPPPQTKVLTEFRAHLAPQIVAALHNALGNLPISWCVYVAGGPQVVALVREHFPVETAVRKLLPLDLLGGDQQAEASMEQEDITKRFFLQPAFYEGFLGEAWLFFQLDAVFCARQRHLLQGFVEKDYGYWVGVFGLGWIEGIGSMGGWVGWVGGFL